MNRVKIRVECSSNKFINYLVYNSIYYTSLVKYKECYELIVNYSDYKRISRMYTSSIIKYYGKPGIKYFIENNKYMIISFLISLMLLRLLCNTIFEIRVNTSSIEIKNIILNSLNNNGISVGKRKKSFDELARIKETILNNNSEVLEWIEITEKGCLYIIDVTPRIKNNIKSEEESSSIYASRDGVIKHINVIRGTKIKELNEYVKKGELLISGNIIKDNTLINRVKASGKVYAETWYFVNTSVPFKYKELVFSGNVVNHYYLDIYGKKFTLLGKYDSPNVKSRTILILDKPYLPFKLYKEEKKIYKEIVKNITVDEAYNIGLKNSEEKIKSSLDEDEYIISKKVLKKDVKSSKIDIEVFFKIYENIGYTSNIDEINNGELNGVSN